MLKRALVAPTSGDTTKAFSERRGLSSNRMAPAPTTKPMAPTTKPTVESVAIECALSRLLQVDGGQLPATQSFLAASLCEIAEIPATLPTRTPMTPTPPPT